LFGPFCCSMAGHGKKNFDVKAGRSRFVFIKEEGD
jgi:hypothetical protein